MTVTKTPRTVVARRIDIRVVLAFLAIYVLWGATFLAIRVAVLQIPPFFTAGVRFFLAGSLLYGFMRLRGEPHPSLVQWRSLALMGFFMFVVTYGALFWAEQFVPSGVTSVLEATIPVITITLEVFIFRQQPFRWSMLAAVAMGFIGVAVLLLKNGSQQIAWVPCFVILGGSTSWSLGTVLTRTAPLPKSRPLTAGAAMMLGGGVLLVLSALKGDMHPFPHISLRAGLALLYLILCGSLIAFTAFVWLLARMPATRVASHAYVNPLVALALGYFVAGEVTTARTLIGAALIIASVFLILKKGDLKAEVEAGA